MEKSKKDEQWAEAKRRCRLNAESIKKAKELGLHPLILIKNIPNKSEQWKVPVSQWIENQYEERKEEVEKRKRVKEKAIRREASKAEKLKADSEKIKYGCLARYTNPYKQEVIFAQMNGFEFTQIWYDNQGLYVNKLRNENVKNIMNHTLPNIVHAVMDINDFDVHLPILKNILKHLKNKEIIIHPVCQSEEITENSIKKLSERMKQTIEFFENKVKIYIENNSKLDPIFHTKEEIELVFRENPKLEFLLDVAHIESYEHLNDMIKIKYPKILHIADKHFDIVHEHLPVGKGEIDFEKVFKEYLSEFKGRIILEVFQSDEEIINSRNIIKSVVDKSKELKENVEI